MTLPLDPLDHLVDAGPTDAGLGRFLAKVYGVLASGLVLSAGVAWTVSHAAPLRELLIAETSRGRAPTTPGWLLALSPLAVLLIAGFRRDSLSAGGASLVYWTTVTLFGGAMAVLALAYAGVELASTFAVTAGAFAALSLAGLAMRRSLSGLRAFLVMVLLGLIVALLVNLVFNSPLAALALNFAGIVIFAGLVAAATQNLRRIYESADDPEAIGVAIDYGALTLFLNVLDPFRLRAAERGGRRR